MKTKDLIELLKQNEEDCHTTAINLSGTRLKSDTLQTSISFDGRSYLLRQSEDQPNNPKVLHAHKQLCKACKVPFAFYKTHLGNSRETVVNGWLSSADPADDNSIYTLGYRLGVECNVVRYLVPLKSQMIDIEDALNTLQAAGITEADFVLGEERDSPVTHLRFRVSETFKLEDTDFHTGISITYSSVDAVDVQCDVYLMDEESQTYLYCSFAGFPYFQAKPTKFQPKDFAGILLGAVAQAKDLATYAHTCVNEEFSNFSDSLNHAVRSGAIPKALYSPLYREMASAEIENMLDFSKHICLVAKDKELPKRIQLERIAGSLAGFILSANKEE